MSFASNFLSITLQFFQSLWGIIAADVQSELYFFGSEAATLVVSWGQSFARYGFWIPTILVAVVGVTFMGLYMVFVFVESGKDLVGE